MKVSDYIVKKLEDLEIDTVFGYTGGSIADVIDSIGKSSSIEFVQSYNEQASSFSANAYAQITGKTGVAVASSGPGAINLINGIANAYYDSIPCVFITGNVHSCARKCIPQIRQSAFQETDIIEMVKSVTKFYAYVQNENDIKYILEKAFHIAHFGRKGPVLIDIPYDIQRKDIDVQLLKGYYVQEKGLYIDIENIKNILTNSRRPLFLLGGGCQSAKHVLREVLEKVQLPVVVSMRGIDLISHQDDCYIGLIGTYGSLIANLAVQYCDLLIVLGSRLDERQMGYDKTLFAPNAKIIQVDIDQNELGRKTDNTISVYASTECFLKQFVKDAPMYSCDGWMKFLNQWKQRVSAQICEREDAFANNFVRQLSELFDADAIISADVGQNQIICAQSLLLTEHNNFLCSAGLACMGYSLPASIGAYYASMNRQIISINGDGGIMMNIQELQTIQREKIPIKIIILNNNCLGLIRKLQENIFDRRYFASVCGYSVPDFKRVADAFGLDYAEIDAENISICKIWLKSSTPVIIEIKLPTIMSTMSELERDEWMDFVVEDFKEQAERV